MAGGERGDAARPLLTTLLVIFAWYTANILLLLLNKFLLSPTKFKQPVFLTLCHAVTCTLLGLIMTRFIPLRPIKSLQQLGKVAILSFFFCITIVLGNASLRYLPVSFNQAIGATTPFFTAVFAYLLQGTSETFVTYLTLIPIMGGIAIASGGEPLFHLIGFTFCMLSTAGRALKSVIQSMIMSDAADKLDPMSLLLYMSAFCVAMLIPLTVALEPTAVERAFHLHATVPHFSWCLLANSLLAYLVNYTNFLVTKYTSPLTLQVLGNAKGVIAAVVSVFIFLNPVTVSGVLGYAMTVSGVFLYSEAKRRGKEQKESKERLPSHGGAAASGPPPNG